MNLKSIFTTDTEGADMRDVVHKTTSVLQGRGKVITLLEHANQKDCVTDVRKNFVYLTQESNSPQEQCLPRVSIRKSFDSVTRDEKFFFRVKGFFNVNQGRRQMRVAYCHTLKINLHWKIKVSSPKKSVTLA